MKALAGGFMTTLEVGIIATLCAFWLGVFLTLVRFFENKVMTGFVKVYVDVFRALPTIVLVSLIHYGAPFIGIYLPLMVSGILTLTLNHSAFFSEILRSGVSAVGHGQLEAARSLGLGTFKTFRLIVFPQAFKTAMPPADRAVRGAAQGNRHLFRGRHPGTAARGACGAVMDGQPDAADHRHHRLPAPAGAADPALPLP